MSQLEVTRCDGYPAKIARAARTDIPLRPPVRRPPGFPQRWGNPYVRLSAVARGGAAFSVTVRSEIGGRGRGERAPHYARLRRALFPVLFRHCTCPSCWDNSNTCPIRTQEFS